MKAAHPTNAFVSLHAHFAATGLWAESLSDLPPHLTEPFAVSLRFLLAREVVAPGLRFRVQLLSPSADGSIDGLFRPFCTHVRFDVRLLGDRQRPVLSAGVPNKCGPPLAERVAERVPCEKLLMLAA